MDKAYEAKYHDLEKTHWWFKGRRAIVRKLLQKIKQKEKLLEIGCSRGMFLQELPKEIQATGIDISKEAIQQCKKQNITNVQLMDGGKTTFAKNTFDVLIASDVLEHIKEDGIALQNWQKILKPGGTLIVFVPACPFLWSKHDEVNHHYRRYTKKQLINQLQKAGLTVTRSSYWNFLLFFPTLVVRTLQHSIKSKTKTTDNLQTTNIVFNTLFYLLLIIENTLLKMVNYPIGVSVFAIGKKPL